MSLDGQCLSVCCHQAASENLGPGQGLLCAVGGDGNKAYEAAVEGRRADLPARLRLFLPALLAYAGSKDTQGAFKVIPFQ